MMCGGSSEVKPATQEIQELVDKVHKPLEEKENRSFNHFKAEVYRSQVVAGTNFFVKVNVGNNEYIHLRIFRPLPGQGDVSLHSHIAHKMKEDELNYF